MNVTDRYLRPINALSRAGGGRLNAPEALAPIIINYCCGASTKSVRCEGGHELIIGNMSGKIRDNTTFMYWLQNCRAANDKLTIEFYKLN